MSTDYWKSSVEGALEEAGITATLEQIKTMAQCVQLSHELYGEANGHEHIPNPVRLENEQLKRELKIEKEKRVCPECKGRGRIIENFGTFQSNSPCDTCNGEGKV